MLLFASILVNIWKRCLVYLWIKVTRDHKLSNLLINSLNATLKLQEVHEIPICCLMDTMFRMCFVNSQCMFYWFFYGFAFRSSLTIRFHLILVLCCLIITSSGKYAMHIDDKKFNFIYIFWWNKWWRNDTFDFYKKGIVIWVETKK